jgi:hypothetical protein
MLDCFLSGVGNQPHLILVGRPGPSADFPPNPGSANIRRVYQNPKFRQVAFKIFLCPVHTSRCEFHRPLWKLLRGAFDTLLILLRANLGKGVFDGQL